MLAWVAEYERMMISEGVKLGMRAARARGKRIGRVPLAINEEKVRANYEKLKSTRAVAQRHGCSDWLVRQILKERRVCSAEPEVFPLNGEYFPLNGEKPLGKK